ncbi:MAG TPA: RDD family protein [Gemmatimonadaceae bacterium]|nr:RDD family protein [Gemmatimonadaceae bacterium]
MASPGARFLAGVLDTLALVVALALAQLVLPRMSVTLAGTLAMALTAAYFIPACGPLGKGRTPGKRALGIRVAAARGGTLSYGASAIRWLVSLGVALPLLVVVASFERGAPLGSLAAMAIALPVLFIVIVDSYLLCVNRPSFQSLHDLAAGSVVVRAAHGGEVPSAPLGRAHYAGMALACLVTTVAFAQGYGWFRVVGPRAIELLRARSALLASGAVLQVLPSTNYATAGADTTWYVVVFATLAARARGEDEANDHRRAFLCALARRAPLTFRSAEVDAAVSFAPGSVETPPVVTYLAQMDLTPAACAQTKAKY